jgi:TonB family protein
MKFKYTSLISIVFLFLAFANTPCQVKSWTTVAPIGESFKVSMPTRAVQVSRVIPLDDRDSFRERVYYSVAEGKRYMVVSFTKTTPDRVAALSSFDKFVVAIQRSFIGREITPVRTISFESDVSSGTTSGNQFHVTLGEYSGVARFLETDKTFFALFVIGAEANDSDAQQFLSSFVMGPSNDDAKLSGVTIDIPANSAELERIKTALPPEPWPNAAAPISGGVLNGKATSLPVPEYPEAGRKNHDSGTVSVEIIIDEQGSVVWAEATEGPESLREAALAAAWKARFTPTRLTGQPVKVRGRILYNFVTE